MFKLIAIQNHLLSQKDIKNKRRHASIYKVLKDNSVYYLYKGWEIKDGIIQKLEHNEACTNLYNKGNQDIDISAIVGKNGSGKSSLLELYLRIMNNLSYVCHKAIGDGLKYNTQFIDEIYSTIYFYDTEDGSCYAVKQYGAKLSYLINGVIVFTHNYNKPLETPGFEQDLFPTADEAKKCLEKLCYTMVINYSAYSYNHEDYLPEWDTVIDKNSKDKRNETERFEDRCWIDSLFHKNDGYQLPVVLNPFREDGLVDYNNERELTQDRLYDLTLLQSTPITTILSGKVLDRFIFDIDDSLNPIGNNTFASYKVMSQLQSMGKLKEVDSVTAINLAEKVGKRIIESWSSCIGVDLASYAVEKMLNDGNSRNPHILQSLNYIVYKTLKIAQIYQKYSSYDVLSGDTEGYVKNLYTNDRSHITQKIRRCITFIIFRHYKGNELNVDQLKNAIERTYKRRVSLMKKARKEHSFNSNQVIKEYKWTKEDFLPAPSFKVSLYLKSSDDVKRTMIRFSTMSSGERQFINSISTFAYHLSNIESVWRRIDNRSTEIGYKNVCVIFDEMDLYLHPDYQTQMINLMLKVIEELNLEFIKSIQIICATHSPFILSDIKSSHVLYLEKGNTYNHKKMKTFAANIGDLLCNSFFLIEGLIGRFTRDKIESLVNWLDAVEEDKKNNKSWTNEEAEEFIKIIDDPFVSMQLKLMLNDVRKKGDLEHAENID